MTISPEQIIAQRHAALRSIRFLALIFFLLAFGVAACWGINEAADELLYWDGIEYWQGIAYIAMFLAPACALLILQRPLARRLAPRPRAECHECGYALKGLNSTRCPECGTATATSDGNPNA